MHKRMDGGGSFRVVPESVRRGRNKTLRKKPQT